MEHESRVTASAAKLSATAHHEAGQLVIAAVMGLPLRPEGLCIDPSGEGLACYWKPPEETDSSRERVIVASFAGWYAQKRFCELRSLEFPELAHFERTSDWREARQVLCNLSIEYLGARSVPEIQRALEAITALQVNTHWRAIEVLAVTLMEQDWESLKPLESRDKWSEHASAKYIAGEEVVVILREFGVRARCFALR